MRIRPLLLLAPTVMAGALLMAAPPVAMASNGMTETGVVTYEVMPDKGQIHVTVRISVTNNKPNEPTSGGYYYYFWNYTQIYVESEAGTLSATSDAGAVSQSTTSSHGDYNLIKLTYPDVYYGQTRVVTASYDLKGAPGSPGGFRAGAAYASLCAIGNGEDNGTVSVIVPDGFGLNVDSGDTLTKSDDTGGKQVFSSGPRTQPYSFYSCVEATNPANLTHSTVTTGGQAFDLRGWPDDQAWANRIQGQLTVAATGLADLTGLKMPSGTIAVSEAGSGNLNDQGVTFEASPFAIGVPESATNSEVAHALSHVWFNKSTFGDMWVVEGLAGYAEKAAGAGNYTPCAQPGGYPGSGTPDLTHWTNLNSTSPTIATDKNVAKWQHAAACYFFTTLADSMGPDNFKAFVAAATADEMAYIGSTPAEKLTGAALPLSAKQVLDLLDERGMVPAGLTDLDQAQKLLANYGVLTADDLAARSTARAAYHSLATSAGKWHLPLAVRGPMSSWDFAAAGTAMDAAKQIIDAREAAQKQLPGFSLDGTDIQKKFESAATQADLDSLVTLIKKESDAAGKVDEATRLETGTRSVLQTIGLVGTDLDTPLKQARTDLQSVKPDQASSGAQSVIDKFNGSSDQGMIRAAIVVGSLVVVIFLILLIVLLRRRRRVPAPVGPGAGYPFAMYPPQGIDPATGAPLWPGTPQAPAGPWQAPVDPNVPQAQVERPAATWPQTSTVDQPPAGTWSPAPVVDPAPSTWPPAPVVDPAPSTWPPAGTWPPAPPAFGAPFQDDPAAGPEMAADRTTEPPTVTPE